MEGGGREEKGRDHCIIQASRHPDNDGGEEREREMGDGEGKETEERKLKKEGKCKKKKQQQQQKKGKRMETFSGPERQPRK